MLLAALLLFRTPPAHRQTLMGGASVETFYELKLAPNRVLGTFEFYATDGETVFLVTQSDTQGKGKPDQILRKSVTGLAEGIKGKLLSTIPVTVRGWPGLECTIQGDKGLDGRYRTYVVDHTLYQIGLVAKPDYVRGRVGTGYIGSFQPPQAVANGQCPPTSRDGVS